jgi:hypothetical protein
MEGLAMTDHTVVDGSLTSLAIEQFIEDGYVRIEGAFPKALAEKGRAILWRDTGCDPDNRESWTKPVIWLGDYTQAPFREAANTPLLHTAFDQLVGAGRWVPRGSLGTFPIRFPSPDDPGDAGWHLDTSFMLAGDDPGNFMHWRANVTSRDRALLMLFLFSDVEKQDAPTRIRAGSHHDIARRLEPAGADGMRLGDLAATGFEETAARPEVLATGEAGTVYLCHPFLVHAAQPHMGRTPRFMAQPPLLPSGAFKLERKSGNYSPVEIAIRGALGRS